MSMDSTVVDSTRRALEEGQTHYVDVPGLAPLRAKLATFLGELGSTGYDADEVLVTAGIQECRFLSIQTLGARLGLLGLPVVVHPGARRAVAVRELAVQPLPHDNSGSMLPTLSGIESALQDGCRLLYLESPSRLTGAAYSVRQVGQIAELVRAFNAAIIWDQGLLPWTDQTAYPSIASIPDITDHAVVIGEAWPGSGLESWFIGYLAAKAEWFEPMRSLKQIIAICTSTPSQYAALKLADLYGQVHPRQVESLTRLRSDTLAAASAVGAQSLPGVVPHLIAFTLAAEDAGHSPTTWPVEVARGDVFGAPGVIRLAVTEAQSAIDAIAQVAPHAGRNTGI